MSCDLPNRDADISLSQIHVLGQGDSRWPLSCSALGRGKAPRRVIFSEISGALSGRVNISSTVGESYSSQMGERINQFGINTFSAV